MRELDISITQKLLLSTKEACAYTGLGRSSIIRILRKPECRHMIIRVGAHKLIRREELESYLANISELPGFSSEKETEPLQSVPNSDILNIQAPSANNERRTRNG